MVNKWARNKVNYWKEQRVRDPKVVGSIRRIWKGTYPLKKVREHLMIGECRHRQITCTERLWMILLLIRTYVDWGYGIRKIVKTVAIARKNGEGEKRYDGFESQLIEIYILVRTVVLVGLLCSNLRCGLVRILVFWEMVGLVALPMRIVFVDRYAYDKKKRFTYRGPYWRPYSFNRNLQLIIWNYFELIVGFAYLYRAFGVVELTSCGNILRGAWEALYFSVVTITTVGYGDMRPLPGWGRFLAGSEAVMGIILLVFIVGSFFVEIGAQRDK